MLAALAILPLELLAILNVNTWGTLKIYSYTFLDLFKLLSLLAALAIHLLGLLAALALLGLLAALAILRKRLSNAQE